MNTYDNLSPGSRAALLVSIAYYLRNFASFYDNPLKNHPKALKDKYSKLPFLQFIGDKLLEQAENLKYEDYSTDDNNVLQNDFLKICFGHHKNLYHMLLLKSFSQFFNCTNDKTRSDIDYYMSNLDPFSILPSLVSDFLEHNFEVPGLDMTLRSFQKLACTFLKDYTDNNHLLQARQGAQWDAGLFVSAWTNFANTQINGYDVEQVGEAVEQLRLKGNQYYKDKQYPEAIACYTEGLEINPNSYQLLCNRGAIYAALNLADPAIVDTAKAVKLHPSSVSAWARLAFNHLYSGFAVESFKDYNNSILAAYGQLYPLNVLKRSEEEKKQYTETASKLVHKRFVTKLFIGMQFARTRAETQGYPSLYLDDLTHPMVKELLKEQSLREKTPPVQDIPASSQPASSSTTRTAEAPEQPQPRTATNIFGNVQQGNGAGDFQQMFSTIQQQINSSMANGDNQGNAQQGLSMINNIMNTFMGGIQGAQPAAPAPTGEANRPRSNEDADPDIDLDDIIEDESANTATPSQTNDGRPNVTIIGGEVPLELRESLNRVTGGLFNFWGDRAPQQNDNQAPVVSETDRTESAGNGETSDVEDHDLD